MKKQIFCLISMMLFSHASFSQISGYGAKNITVGGYVGERIETCIEHQVKTRSVDMLVEPFKHLTEGNRWQMEFVGKWLLGAVESYRYTGDSELLDKIHDAARKLSATQREDGYIGNYKPENRLTHWDIWGRKYTALSLLSYYRLTGDKATLEAVKRSIDCLIAELSARNVDIAATGNYLGMASCSILEPVVYLYKESGEERYLDFAKSIVTNIEKEGRAQLVAKALGDVPVSQRSAYPREWWSYDNGQKAYEMMSCYEGMIELGKVLDDPKYLDAAERTVGSILRDEINIAGSGAAFECWYGGKHKQTIPTYHMMETCVTFTWMQLCARLLQATGNSLYADQMDLTMYNALMAAMKGDGGHISKYSPLEGRRGAGEKQCGMPINCCNANGPRGYALIPEMAYQSKGDSLFVNLYLNSTAEIEVDGKLLKLDMQTSYPVSGRTTLGIDPVKSRRFNLALRIPAWKSGDFVVAVNGDRVEGDVRHGYMFIDRKWNRGDVVTVDFDIASRVEILNNCQAVTHGPLVFARDSRFGDGDVDECASIQCDADMELKLDIRENDGFAWLTAEVPMILGTDLEDPENSSVCMVRFCDFASAGNDWDRMQRYRVWIPRTLHVMLMPYHKY